MYPLLPLHTRAALKYTAGLAPHAIRTPGRMGRRVGIQSAAKNRIRTVAPDKDTYRGMVAEHWKNTTSEGSGGYNPNTINDRIYFNTGQLLYGLLTPPVDPPMDRLQMMADSIRDWNGTNAQPQGQWEYGYYSFGTTFVHCGAPEIFASWIGGDGQVWSRGAGLYPRIGQYSMAPHATPAAVRCWTSLTDSRPTVTVDARQIEPSVNNQTVELVKNGTSLASLPLTASAKHRVEVMAVDVDPGDTLDVVVRSLGNQNGDWTAVSVRVDNLRGTMATTTGTLPCSTCRVARHGCRGSWREHFSFPGRTAMRWREVMVWEMNPLQLTR